MKLATSLLFLMLAFPICGQAFDGNFSKEAERIRGLDFQSAISELNKLYIDAAVAKNGGYKNSPLSIEEIEENKKYHKNIFDGAIKTSAALRKYREHEFSLKKEKNLYSINIKQIKLKYIIKHLQRLGAEVRISDSSKYGELWLYNFKVDNLPIHQIMLTISKMYRVPVRYYHNTNIYSIN